jgi:hypothetical protein
MFFLLIPPFSALISLLLSRWIPGLQFVPRPMFFIGIALVTIPLILLSLSPRQASLSRNSAFGRRVQEDDVEPASVGARDRRFAGGREIAGVITRHGPFALIGELLALRGRLF